MLRRRAKELDRELRRTDGEQAGIELKIASLRNDAPVQAGESDSGLAWSDKDARDYLKAWRRMQREEELAIERASLEHRGERSMSFEADRAQLYEQMSETRCALQLAKYVDCRGRGSRRSAAHVLTAEDGHRFHGSRCPLRRERRWVEALWV